MVNKIALFILLASLFCLYFLASHGQGRGKISYAHSGRESCGSSGNHSGNACFGNRQGILSFVLCGSHPLLLAFLVFGIAPIVFGAFVFLRWRGEFLAHALSKIAFANYTDLMCFLFHSLPSLFSFRTTSSCCSK